MKQKDNFTPPAVGGSSLLVIFAVLCFAVFALLALSSVQAERREADAAVKSTYDYYDADLRAQEIYALLRNGEKVEGVQEKDGIYEYQVPVSERQTLVVRVANETGDWEILQWQVVPVETELDDTLDVWKGTQSKEEIQ
jgi:hypothetical protein